MEAIYVGCKFLVAHAPCRRPVLDAGVGLLCLGDGGKCSDAHFVCGLLNGAPKGVFVLFVELGCDFGVHVGSLGLHAGALWVLEGCGLPNGFQKVSFY